MELKFGACLSWEYSSLLKEAGGDFIELPLAKVALLEESDFRELLQNLVLPAEVFNIFLPSNFKIMEENLDWKELENYLSKALGRAKRLGGEVIVFGSGGARRAPDSLSPQEIGERLLGFLSLVSDIAEREGLRIAIEHLNRGETNTITSFAEALQLAGQLGRDSVGVLVDIYHLAKEKEKIDTIKRAGGKLFHIHLSDLDRNPPLKEDEVIKDFFYILKKMNYQNRISLECRWNNLEIELPMSIEILKKQWEVCL